MDRSATKIKSCVSRSAKRVEMGLRVFTLGIDRAVNEAFLKRLADLGGGGYTLVESEEQLDEVMDQVHRHIATPVLTGLRLEPAGLAFVPGSIVPARLPDLFAGTPVVVTGRYRGPAGGLALQAREAAGGLWSGAGVRTSRRQSRGNERVGARPIARSRRPLCHRAQRRPGKRDRGNVAAVRRVVPLHGVRGGGSVGGSKSGRAGSQHRAAGGAAGRMGGAGAEVVCVCGADGRVPQRPGSTR